MAEERLQKVMAAAGVGSRRACEQLIAAGKVRVNGRLVSELGAKVDPEQVQITVDGKPVHLPQRHLYLMVHKPRGVLGDIGDDPDGRPTVLDLAPAGMRRVFPVGRLDLHSEGLMLLTDDGELAHHLTHPRFQHPKTYYVLVEQRPGESALAQFRRGVDLPEGRSAPASIRVVQRLPAELNLGAGPTQGVWLEVVLREGKKRQIRHMTAAIGHPTLRLVRWAIGPLTLGSLKAGETRPLSRRDITALRQMVAEQPAGAAKQSKPIQSASAERGRRGATRRRSPHAR
ncbi:MAG: pseudouridine synthase [Chloroflexi bacterium]|nr:MAG: pseudouridine synthase [Chloroflexota bacterium]